MLPEQATQHSVVASLQKQAAPDEQPFGVHAAALSGHQPQQELSPVCRCRALVFLFAGWPAEAYLLIGRDDIAATVAAAMPAADASAAGRARPAPGPEMATPQWPGTTPHQIAPLGRTPFRQPHLSSSMPGTPWEPSEKLKFVINFTVEPRNLFCKGRPPQPLLSQQSYAAEPLQGIVATKLALLSSNSILGNSGCLFLFNPMLCSRSHWRLRLRMSTVCCRGKEGQKPTEYECQRSQPSASPALFLCAHC